MGARDRLERLIAGSALVVLAAGCSGAASEPELGVRPSEAMEEIERTKQAAIATASGGDEAALLPERPSDNDAAAIPTEPASSEPAPQPVDRTKAVHFETANPKGKRVEQPTLFEASEAERARRQDSTEEPSTVVITDANLGDYAKGGRLTEMTRDLSDDSNEASGPAAVATPAAQDAEAYWRSRVRDSRLAWRAAADRVIELQSEVARLRFEFYAQDDPAYRDLEIKPAWDRAAVELTQARLRVSDLEMQVEQVQAAGLEAGALPGWLREGLEFEPEPEEERGGPNRFGVAEAIEPPIMDDPPR